MKFEKLKDFITNEMKLGDNDRKYQPIVIRFLVQNGGSATRKEIENEIDAVNWHYKPLPTTKNPFAILTDDFPVCEYDEPTETYNLGKDFADYSINDKAWTIVECALKDETRKHALEEIVEKSRKVVSQLTNERDEVLGRYGPGGKDDLTSEKITKEKFIEFWRKENNYHWKAVNQAAGHVVKDIDMLRKNLKILFNENISIVGVFMLDKVLSCTFNFCIIFSPSISVYLPLIFSPVISISSVISFEFKPLNSNSPEILFNSIYSSDIIVILLFSRNDFSPSTTIFSFLTL